MLTEEDIHDFFISLKGSVLTYPFGDEARVYKVGNKMFGLITTIDNSIRINLKGDPDNNIALRGMFDSIKPGYHMNKEHWNSLYLDGTLEDDLIKRLIEESYELVVSKLAKRAREELAARIED